MKARAFAAPAATLWLVANGIFRGMRLSISICLNSIPSNDSHLFLLKGFGDTLTPLKFSILLNIVNFLLDPIMFFEPLSFFGCGWSRCGNGDCSNERSRTTAVYPPKASKAQYTRSLARFF
jgi:hypothetical protein